MCVGGRVHVINCVGCGPTQKVSDVVVPLTGVVAVVNIVDFVAEVTLKQRFENVENFPIEAVYEFPLSTSTALCSFKAEIDGLVIESQLKELEKAKDTYSDAIASGHGAYLLEQRKDLPHIFSASVGNLPPKKAVLITIQYAMEVGLDESADANQLRFVLPTQPYAPNGQGPFPKFARPVDVQFTDSVPYGLSVSVCLNMTSATLTAFTSPSAHTIEVQQNSDSPSRATVQLRLPEPGVPLTRDFELLATLSNASVPSVRVEESSGRKTVMLSVCPQLGDAEDQPSEMIFLVDRSGSMGGAPMKAVKETLQIFLRSLPMNTLFNIIGFGSSIEMLFPNAEKYDEKTLELASKAVAAMDANLGGTDICTPLLKIFAQPTLPGTPRQIFLLTDGEVGNTDECIRAVRDHAHTTRVFTFGIGDGASVRLVQGMAEAGEGKAEFLKSSSDSGMQRIVLRQLNRALRPALTDLRVDWGALQPLVEQTPYHIPPVFSGSRLVVYGLLPREIPAAIQSEPVKVAVLSRTGKGEAKTVFDVDLRKLEQNSPIATRLAARSAIRDLQHGRSFMHNASTHKLLSKYQSSDLTARIVSLSLSSGILSDHTAFVAVEKRSDATGGEMKLRKIGIAPVQPPLPAVGYGGMRRVQVGPGTNSYVPKKDAGGAAPPRTGYGGGMRPVLAGPGSSNAAYRPTYDAGKGCAPAAPNGGYRMVGAAVGPSASSLQYSEQTPAAASASTGYRMAGTAVGPSGDFSSSSSTVYAPTLDTGKALDTPKPKSEDSLNYIILTQSASGSFSLASVQLFIPSASAAGLSAAFSELPSSLDTLLFATAVVIAYIEKEYADRRENWELVVKKARKWFAKEAVAAGVAETYDWNSAAKRFLSA